MLSYLKHLTPLKSAVPFFEPLQAYTWNEHKAALAKFVALWGMSVFPLLCVPFLHLMYSINQGSFSGDALTSAWEIVGGSHQFIYAASFIVPVIYLGGERYREHQDHIILGKTSLKDIKLTPKGFLLTLGWCVLFLLVTSMSFAVASTIPELTTGKNNRFLQVFAIVCYAFSLLCWYFCILDEKGIPEIDFSRKLRDGEQEQTDSLKERLARRNRG